MLINLKMADKTRHMYVHIEVIEPDILRVTGNLQLCAGQEAGVEAAVHAVHALFNESTDVVLLVDVNNVFTV